MEAYQTQNLALATALFTCGVPFFEHEPGRSTPVVNIYTTEILREYRDNMGLSLYRGMGFEDAAEHAWKNGRPGKVTFCFAVTPKLTEVIAAYNAQTERIKASDDRAISTGDPCGELPGDVDTIATLACQILSNRNKLRDAWKAPQPLISFPGPVKTKTEGNVTYETGSFKILSLNSANKTREHLKL